MQEEDNTSEIIFFPFHKMFTKTSRSKRIVIYYDIWIQQLSFKKLSDKI